MTKRVKQTLRTTALFIILLMLQVTAFPQEERAKPIRIPKGSNSVTIKGHTGGESNDNYVIQIEAGRTLSVRFTEDKGEIRFLISTTDNGDQVDFGSISKDEMSWEGIVPQTGNYYIHVEARPASDYKMTVMVK
jgi:hypothetical protein